MEQITLDVQVREELGSQRIKKIRYNDFIPAVVYGSHKKNTIIKIDRRTFERIERQHHGESIFLYLNILEGNKKLKEYAVLVKELQYEPVSNKILHVDFQRISLTKEIEVQVPLMPQGEPVGVKKDGGSLDHLLWEIDIVCLPTNIPAHINVDVSSLEINGSIYVRDIILPEGVRTKHDPDAIAFTVVPPKEEQEPQEVAEGEAVKEPEVIKEKKDKAEGKEKKEESKEKTE